MSRPRKNEPWRVVDAGLQAERTTLAGERTAVAVIVVGLLLTRYASEDGAWVAMMAGLSQTLIGAIFLVWSGHHYVGLHGPITRGTDVVHPTATRALGLASVVFAGVAMMFAAVEIGTR